MARKVYFDYVNQRLGVAIYQNMREIIPADIDVTIILSIKQILPSTNYFHYVMMSKMIMENMGFTINHCQVLCNQGNTNIDQLMSSALIFLAGGNPVEQMQVIRYLALEPYLKEYNHGIIAGHSAGSMSMGKTVIEPPTCTFNYAGRKRDIKPIDTCSGLALDELIVIPHLEEVNYRLNRIKIRTVGTWDVADAPYLEMYETPIIGLLDGSALITDDERQIILGAGAVEIQNNKITKCMTTTTPQGRQLILKR